MAAGGNSGVGFELKVHNEKEQEYRSSPPPFQCDVEYSFAADDYSDGWKIWIILAIVIYPVYKCGGEINMQRSEIWSTEES